EFKKAGDDKVKWSLLYAERSQKMQKMQRDDNMEYFQLIEKYPYSVLSIRHLRFLALLNSHSDGSYQQTLEETWEKMPESVRSSKDGKAIFDSIQLTKNKYRLQTGALIPDYT